VNNSRLDRTKEKVSEFVNQQKLPNMKNRENNNEQNLRYVEHQGQLYQYTHNGIPKRRERSRKKYLVK